jgi:hypothetical protein
LLGSAAPGVYRPPVKPTEVMLCAIWAEVLGASQIGLDDDFFALGGHSLLAVRVAARLGEALGRKIELGLLFAHPALAELAEQLDRAGANADEASNALDALQDLMDSL